MSVFVVGEALVDLIVAPDGQTTAVPGGGPFNTARTIARLGVPVSFCGGVSDDVFGRRIAGLLDADGVTLAIPARTGLLTTLALAELDEGGAATYRFYTQGTAAPAVTADDIVLPADAGIVSVGTLALVLEPLATACEALVRALPDTTMLFLDPNCRPSIISDRATYRERIRALVSRADVVKVSGDDLAYLRPDLAPRDAARSLLADGARLVLFTDGASAVWVLTADGERELPVPRVPVVDTVGAGDAFGGAFMASWHDAGLGRTHVTDLDRAAAAAERAIVVAGITCGRPGADPPHLREL